MAYIKMWRADTYFRRVEAAEVDESAPVGKWLLPMMGDGLYAYFKDEKQAKDALIVCLLEEIDEIQTTIDKLSKEEE